MQTILYVQLNLFTGLLCLLLLCHNRRSKGEVIGKKTFQSMLFVVCIVIALNTISWISEGNQNTGMHLVYFVTLELEFVLQILPCFMMLVYTQENQKKLSGFQRTIRLVPFLLGVAIMILNLWIPFVFRINEFNCYERLSGFYLVGSIPVAYLIWSLINCIIAYKRETAEKRQTYFQYMVLLLFPIAGTMIQIFSYGLETRWMMTTLGFIYIYINVQKNREQNLIRELSEIKVSTMLSQIQYHFVFNTLSTIENHCVDNPGYANEMLECFQKYLRYNLEAVNYIEQVHFTEELEHTRQYLTLEKMRFGEHFIVKYDLQEEDFFLPVLSLQPIVEHAVRYGVCKSEKAGTVVIQTKKVDNNILLMVQDNGQAVDADGINELDADKQELAGLVNVKKRIEGSQYGKVMFYSRKEMGTFVTIQIPV